jgi:hypothetical protein
MQRASVVDTFGQLLPNATLNGQQLGVGEPLYLQRSIDLRYTINSLNLLPISFLIAGVTPPAAVLSHSYLKQAPIINTMSLDQGKVLGTNQG